MASLTLSGWLGQPGVLVTLPAVEPASRSPISLPTDLSIPALERAIFEQVNDHRRSLGLSPLILDTRVSVWARNHSQDMAGRRIRFGHTGLRQRALEIDRMIRSRRISETVAYIFTHKEPAKRAVSGWLRSPNHRPTLEGQFTYTGVGVAQDQRGAFYFTQIFVRPR